MKIFFHTRLSEKHSWKNSGIELRNFSRLPAVGEFICVEDGSSEWHRVELVVHVAFEADYVAEVYCMTVDHLQAMHPLDRLSAVSQKEKP